jgi:threonyl-tRNA synthetase
MQQQDKESLDQLRHSAAHLLAAAVMELWPDTKRTIGPSIENGFYYDFAFSQPISDEDLPRIEAKMREILPTWQGFARHEVTKDQALQDYADNPFKQELITQFTQEGQNLTYYQSGSFFDLCRGGHVDRPAETLQFFKLLSLAGAYWRGDEKNPMLTRIYGTAWPSQQELEAYLTQLEEAKKRDHRKLGPALDLFFFHETAPGMPYWLPKGVVIVNELVNFWRQEHKARGYQEIVSPLINKQELYVTSGHWEHYREDMFIAQTDEGEVYGLKPMNCPNAMVVFGTKLRSYRDLPLRLGDTDTLHRAERSGTLNGLLRAREFRQDDAHIFVTESQVEAEYQNLFELVERFYSIFNLDYSFRLGTRPESYMGDLETWNQAESTLKAILEHSKKDYFIEEGDGAFYGPKIDILMKDSLGRSWQMGTIQLDFQLPRNFKLTYVDTDGKEKTPITIHRVIYGSLERFIGILTEHYAGAFPLWIAPVQAMIIPISDKHMAYAQQLRQQLDVAGIRVELDGRNESMGAKIRDAQMQKVPYMLVVGDKEQTDGSVAVRHRDGGAQEVLQVDAFLDRILQQISQKS